MIDVKCGTTYLFIKEIPVLRHGRFPDAVSNTLSALLSPPLQKKKDKNKLFVKIIYKVISFEKIVE